MFKKLFFIVFIGLMAWQTQGISQPKSTDKPAIQLIYFSGSDWCANCIRLKENILTNKAFVEYLEANQLSIEQIDFPQRKKLTASQRAYNESVAEKYAFDGNFPTLLLAREDTMQYMKLNYENQTVDEMISQIKKTLKQLQ